MFYYRSLLPYFYSSLGPVASFQNQVAFFVEKEGTQSALGTVTFQVVVTQQGGIWNTVVNNFIIPTKGMYFLTHTAMATGDGYVASWIRRDTTNIREAYAHGTFATTTTSIVIELEAYSQMSCYLNHATTSLHNNRHTHFGGFLIYPL